MKIQPLEHFRRGHSTHYKSCHCLAIVLTLPCHCWSFILAWWPNHRTKVRLRLWSLSLFEMFELTFCCCNSQPVPKVIYFVQILARLCYDEKWSYVVDKVRAPNACMQALCLWQCIHCAFGNVEQYTTKNSYIQSDVFVRENKFGANPVLPFGSLAVPGFRFASNSKIDIVQKHWYIWLEMI